MDWIFEYRERFKKKLYRGLNLRATLESPREFETSPMWQVSPVKRF